MFTKLLCCWPCLKVDSFLKKSWKLGKNLNLHLIFDWLGDSPVDESLSYGNNSDQKVPIRKVGIFDVFLITGKHPLISFRN